MLDVTTKYCERVTRRLLSDGLAARRWRLGIVQSINALLPSSIADAHKQASPGLCPRICEVQSGTKAAGLRCCCDQVLHKQGSRRLLGSSNSCTASMVAPAVPAQHGGRRIVCLRDALDEALRSALVIAEYQA